jgi:acetyl esterase/lipase
VEWKIDPKRIGIMGFSAGGHLSVAVSTKLERAYAPVDAADEQPHRPDFALPIYPAYLAKTSSRTEVAPEFAPALTPENRATVPPMFFAQAENDGGLVEGTLTFYFNLKLARVPAELHLYANGGHGYGLRSNNPVGREWPRLAEAWMRNLGLFDSAESFAENAAKLQQQLEPPKPKPSATPGEAAKGK